MQSSILIFTAILSAASLSAFAADWSPLGEPASPYADARTVVIDKATKIVNVYHDEEVKFNINGREFTWRFDGTQEPINLSQIAPASAIDHPVSIYVADVRKDELN